MLTLEKLAKILEESGDLVVEKTDEGILVKEVKEADGNNSGHLDLINFIKVYEKNPDVKVTEKGIVINSKTFTSTSLMMLLQSVFKDYDFKATGQYQIIAEPKTVGESLEEQKEFSFEKLAEEIDSKFDCVIELHEDGLKIVGGDLEKISEEIDKINPSLVIKLKEEEILVGETK